MTFALLLFSYYWLIFYNVFIVAQLKNYKGRLWERKNAQPNEKWREK